jgi:nucleoside-diphosphate-sugar epimerase
MKILITGGNGFIGSHLAEMLVKEENFQVSLLDVKFNENTADIDCTKFVGDICDKSLTDALDGMYDVIVHLAAVSRVELGQLNPLDCLKTNIVGTSNMLELLRKERSRAVLVFGSSREVYGEQSFLPVAEEHPKNPISVYGVSKLAAERLLSSYHRVYGVDYILLRFSNVYGSPRDLPDRVAPRFMRLAMAGQPLTVYGGKQVLDFTFIDDTVNGLISVLRKVMHRDETVINQDFNFTSGNGTSILEIAELIKSICQSDSEIIVESGRSYDVSNFVGSYQKAKEFLDYCPKHSLVDGLSIYGNRLTGQ